MYHEHQDSNAGFAAGVITGALVGAGLALLLAPKSGAALRDELGESWTSLRDAVARRYRDLAERAGVELENFQERVDRRTPSRRVRSSSLTPRRRKHARSGATATREETRSAGTPIAFSSDISARCALCGPTLFPRQCEWEAA